MEKNNSKISLKLLVETAVFSALAAVIMLFKFPLPFAPIFYKFELSEVVVLLAGFSLGIIPAVAVELIKVLLNLLMDGTVTIGIGELSNFLMGCMFVVPASLIYNRKKSLKFAVIGVAVGCAAMSIGACIINYYMLIPFYASAYGMPIDTIVSMGTKINAKIVDLKSLVILATLPFNIVKSVCSAVVTIVAYKPLEKLLDSMSKKH